MGGKTIANSENKIEALVFRCAPLTISGNAPNYQLNIGNATNTSPIGGENAGTASVLGGTELLVDDGRPLATDF